MAEEHEKDPEIQELGAVDHVEHGGTAFLANLPLYFSKPEIQSYFRTTSLGLFIHEEVLERFLKLYQTWLQQKTNAASPKSVTKCMRRLFETEQPVLYYLLDGNRCLPGYLMPIAGLRREQHQHIPHYGANLLDTAEYLHPRDPILQTISGLKAEMRPHYGLVLSLTVNGRLQTITGDALTDFSKTAREMPYLAAEYPSLAGPVRDAISPLVDLLHAARSVGRKERLLMPLRYREQDKLRMLRAGPLVFVMQEPEIIVGCFGTSVRTAQRVFREDLERLRSGQGGRRPKGFELSASRRAPFLGRIVCGKAAFLVDPRAVLQFFHFVRRAHLSAKVLVLRYTALEVLETFALFFAAAKPEQQTRGHAAQKRTRSNDKQTIRYRRNGAWIFGVDGQNVIRQCLMSARTGALPGKFRR